VLADTPVDTLRDVLRWHLIRSAASSLAPAFDEENFAFYGRILGWPAGPAAPLEAGRGAASADVGEAVAQLFVHETFPPEAKARVETLVEHLLSAMGRAIRGNTWMTDATREEALRSSRRSGTRSGTRIGGGTTGLTVDRGATSRAGSRPPRSRCAASSKLGSPVDEHEWAMPAHIVNAYYHRSATRSCSRPDPAAAVLPRRRRRRGQLRRDRHGDRARDHARLRRRGLAVRHQRALRNWWTDEDRAEFERRANVIVEQFNAYRSPTTSPSTGASRWARTSRTSAAPRSRSTRCTRRWTPTPRWSTGSP
jgi:predicted metalloendopeptidase